MILCLGMTSVVPKTEMLSATCVGSSTTLRAAMCCEAVMLWASLGPTQTPPPASSLRRLFVGGLRTDPCVLPAPGSSAKLDDRSGD